jgi:ABC-type oligopeptide transport system ATPase subunit
VRRRHPRNLRPSSGSGWVEGLGLVAASARRGRRAQPEILKPGLEYLPQDALAVLRRRGHIARMPLLSVRHLRTWFPVYGGVLRRRTGEIKAVDDVSFDIGAGQTVGLVGESGSGKTTVGRTLLKLTPATSGEVIYEGRDILPMSEAEFRPLRKDLQIIFQDPFGSLNPRMTVGAILAEPLEIHFPEMTKSDRRERVAELLKLVGLPPDAMGRYPHEFSGGQRQRIGIARALAVKPKFIVCDEPVSALDVSVQAQIVNLLQDLQEQLGVAYLFIAHDLAVVQHVSDHVIVMHHGKIVESAPAAEIYENPQHDYTKKLLSAVPKLAA